MLLCLAHTPLLAGIVTGSLGSHDPSRMINCDGTYYIYSTGGRMKYSTDRINWLSGPSPFTNGAPVFGGPQVSGTSRFTGSHAPASVKALVPVDQGIWAPDVIYYHSKYLLYYSAAAPGGTSTAIGLSTSPTLDPKSPAYHWTDVGVVVSDHDREDLRSSIDPCPFIDAEGNLWLSYGSGFGKGVSPSGPTIFIIKLDNATGLPSSTDTNRYPVAFGHIEGSYVHYHGGYYYLFWNSGGCCNGAKSSYTIHMARSRSVTGPYLDKNGKERSSAIFLAPTVAKNSVDGNEHGPGQLGILSEGGIDRCTYHYYPENGRSVIGEETVLWGADGWPEAGTDLAPGTYKISSGTDGEVLAVRAGGDPAIAEPEPDNGSQLQRWIVAFTFIGGTNADGFYSITSAGSGKALSLLPSGSAVGVVAGQSAAGVGDNQRWIIEQTGDGSYRIAPRTSGSVLSLSPAGTNSKPAILCIKRGPDSQPGTGDEWKFTAP